MTREALLAYCADKFGTEADYPFERDALTAVFRHAANRRWYGIVMRIHPSRLGLPGDKLIDIVNLKLPLELRDSFGPAEGVLPGYHMNKAHWVSLPLESSGDVSGSAVGSRGHAALYPLPDDETIRFLLGVSYEVTRPVIKPRKARDEK